MVQKSVSPHFLASSYRTKMQACAGRFISDLRCQAQKCGWNCVGKKKWKRGKGRVEEGGEINKFNPIIG